MNFCWIAVERSLLFNPALNSPDILLTNKEVAVDPPRSASPTDLERAEAGEPAPSRPEPRGHSPAPAAASEPPRGRGHVRFESMQA